MPEEIECKIMGMNSSEFINMAQKKGANIKTSSKPMTVKDTYWDLPDVNLIRHRHITYWDDSVLQDVTIKGYEINAKSNIISKREENILNVQASDDVGVFLSALGAKEKYIVVKQRTYLTVYGINQLNQQAEPYSAIRVQHDKIANSDFEWIEIEADTEKSLIEFIKALGIKETTNKSTLDILGIDK